MKQLVGQVINIHTIYIKDLTFFRARLFGCDTPFICCYKDVKFAKQNQAVSVEFKRQYENQTLMARVESIAFDNVLVNSDFFLILNTRQSNDIFII